MKIQRTRYQLVCRQFLQTLLTMKKFEQRENELYNEPFDELQETLDARLEFLKDDLTSEQLNHLRSSALLLETQFPGCCFIPGKVFIQLHDGSSIREVDEKLALELYDASVIGWFMFSDCHNQHQGYGIHKTIDECASVLFNDFRFDSID